MRLDFQGIWVSDALLWDIITVQLWLNNMLLNTWTNGRPNLRCSSNKNIDLNHLPGDCFLFVLYSSS